MVSLLYSWLRQIYSKFVYKCKVLNIIGETKVKLFNTIAASVTVALVTAGSAHADVNSQLASLQAQISQLQSQINNSGSTTSGLNLNGMVGVNSALSWQMMSNQTGVGKELNLLQARQNGLNTPVTIGGYAQANIAYGHTNLQGFFGTSNSAQIAETSNSNYRNTNVTRLLLSNADLSATAAIGQWVTAYLQLGESNIGDSTASGLAVDNVYAVIGNLAKNPVYGFIGNKDIDFGSFQTVDMMNQPLTRTLFMAHGNTAGVGVNSNGFNGTVSAMNGGDSTSNSNFGLGTTNQNNISNYAVNLSYGMTNSGVNWNVGAGYLSGTSFIDTAGKNSAAWDVNAKVSVASFDVLAEYVATTKKTTGLISQNSNKIVAVSGEPGTADAWTVGADYNFPVMGLNSVVDAEYSRGTFNADSNQNAQQYVAGFSIEPVSNVWTGLSYAYNKGGLIGSSGVTSFNNAKNSTVLLNVSAAF